MIGILASLAGIVLSYAKSRDDKATALAVEQLRADIAEMQARADLAKAKLSHRIAWMPQMWIEFMAAFYFTGWIVDKTFNLPGDMQDLPASQAALLGLVYAGMFGKATLRR